MDLDSLSEWAKDKPLSILQLDPADRAVLRIADERDAIQKKTFTKWVNKHLKKANRRVEDLFEDLRDGHNLLSLLEVLSGEHLPREKGKMRFHMLQNAQMALDFLRFKKIKLVNIRAEDIVDGNPKLTLGLIWTIILHFQISDIVVGKDDNVSAREALLRWARHSTSRYPGVRVNDFTSSWRDGLAFSALVHRNRPDLLDWRKARSDRPRERLEKAFHVVEKEYGVTRLLDPEDVDTNEPDEKSLITYISSLYDVFPEPPSIHPLFDVDSQRRVHEYRDLAQQFISWCREKTIYLQERSFPPTLIEMKRLLSDLHHFRNEEVSSRKREKVKLVQIYKELERYFETMGEVDVEQELRPEAIENSWYRVQTAMNDREIILQEEIERLERLQRLADKLQREIKPVDMKIGELELRVKDEETRIDRLHPIDAKNIVESLESEIRHLDDVIRDMQQSCQVLSDGRYPHAADLQKKVNRLHQRWSQLHSSFHNNLVRKLSGLKYPVQEKTVTRQTRMIIESRQIDTNPFFRDLQDHTEWCQNKLKQLLAADYGSDLPSVKDELDRQQREHKIIDQFHTKIVQAERAKSNFSGDELNLYEQRLANLQKVYAELLSVSTKRLSDLDTLQHFLTQASAELQWLNEKEHIEITRDWADVHLDLPSVHKYYENLMSELEKRELHFATILDSGEALLNQQHPASKCIETHLTVLQQQWAWLLQLTLCLEVHLKNATDSHRFFTEIKDAEKWLKKRDDILNSTFSQSDFGLDQGETLLRGMQDLREELNAFGETVASLQTRAQTIVPLSKRRQPVTSPSPVQAICAYKQQGQLQLDKGEKCTLLDNSGRVKWRVRSSIGQEGTIPGECLLMPPPDQEAIDAAERIKRLFDRSVSLWQKKHLRLRQNMIFATIRVVKGWTFDQFMAMGPEQRTAIRRALNDDADKLISEGDPNDPQLRRLRREMEEVNRLFDEFEKRARAEEESKQASRIFTEECVTIKSKLEEMARELDQIILAPLPRDYDSLEHALQIHDDFHMRLQHLEPELEHLQETFRTIALKTPVLKKSLDNLLELWKELNTQSNLHRERLKLLGTSLAGLEDNEHFISDVENKLAKHYTLPSTTEGLHSVFKQLTHLHDIITQQQPQMDKMNDAADQLGRMGVPTKVLGDLKRLHSNVERLNMRWSTACQQIGERLRACENAVGLMKNLQSNEEETWVDGAVEKLNVMPTATSAIELDKLLGVAVEHKPKIESVNLTGGRLIREAKIYDSKCLRFIDWLEEMRPSFSPPEVYRSSSEPGAAEHYSDKLHTLNSKYERLLELILQRRKTAIEVNGTGNIVNSQFAKSLQKPLEKYATDLHVTSTDINKQYDTVTTKVSSYSTTDKTYTSSKTAKSEYIYSNAYGTTANVPEQLLLSTGLRHPKTNVVLSVGEAINLHILDIRNNEIIINENERITLEEAARRELLEPALLQKLKMYNANNKSAKDMSTAIHDGSVDAQMGLYRFESGRTISLAEAYELGYLIKHESITIKSNALCLSDAIAHGLVDAAGWITDRNTGDKFRLDTAIDNKLIDAQVREIVDAKNDVKITLQQALDSGILNAKTGRYVNRATKEKLTFVEAKNRQLIVKPYTLKDICDLNLLDKQGKITSPMRREQLSMLQAMEAGVLDSNNLKCVSRRRGELMTLLEAITEGVILPHETKYKDPLTSEIISIPEAVERGLISTVSQRSIFEIDGFKDYHSNDFVNYNTAITRGILRRKSTGFVLETAPNTQLPLDEALQQELVRAEVYEMFNRGIGVYNADKKQLSLLDLCYNELIDTNNGYLLDPESKIAVPLDLAIERKLITPEGALLLSSLLNITLTTETVVRTINRYVTIQNAKDTVDNLAAPTFTEAIKQGLIDADRKLFKDPKTDNIYSVQQALGYGLLQADPNSIIPEPTIRNKQTTTLISVKQIVPEPEPIEMTTQKYTERVEHVFTTKAETAAESPRGVSTPEPVQLASGIIYDPLTSLVIFTNNGQTENILSAVQQGHVDEKLVSINDLANNEKISLSEAIERKIYDPHTNRIFVNKNQSIDLMEAAKMGILAVVGAPLVAAQGVLHTIRLITDPRTGEEIPVEVAYERGIVSKDQMFKCYDSAATSPEKVVILQKLRKVILQPADALHRGLIDEETCKILENEQNFINQQGDIITIAEALRLELIDGQQGKIKDPHSNRVLNIAQAVKEKLLDPEETNHLLVPLARRVSLPTLLQQGLIDDKAQKIIHPESGCLLNIREAIVCDIIDPLSRLNKPTPCTLAEAIDKDIVNEQSCTLKVDNKTVSLTEALAKNVFEVQRESLNEHIPAVGMTLPVVVERGLLNVNDKTIMHPHTKLKMPVNTAIEKNFIMSIPYPPKTDAIELEQALNLRLIDVAAQQLISPQTQQRIPLREALQTGMLVVQPLKDFVAKQKPYPKSNIMETKHIQHTVTTKTIELLQGHVLVSNNEIKNVKTGQVCSIEEGKEIGIVIESKSNKKNEKDELVNYANDISAVATSTKDFIENEKSINGYPAENMTIIEPEPLRIDNIKIEKTITTTSTTQHSVTISQDTSLVAQADIMEQVITEPIVSSPTTIKPVEENQSQTLNISIVPQSAPINEIDHIRESSVEIQPIATTAVTSSVETWINVSEMPSTVINKAVELKTAVSSFMEAEKLASNTVQQKEVIKDEKLNSESTQEPQHVEQAVAPIPLPRTKPETIEIEKNEIIITEENAQNLKPTEDEIDHIIDNPILQKIEELNLYDEEHHYFIDPSTGQKISFQTLFLEEGIFDPDTILVKNFNNGNYEELTTALERPLLDKHTGHMVDPKTGKKIPFTECVLRSWIVQSAPKVEKPAAIEHEIDAETGRVMLEDGTTCSIVDAINNGQLNMKSISVRDPVSGEVIPLRMAIELGVVDMQAGTVIDIQTLKEIPMEEAFMLGFLVAGSRKPISLEAAIRKGLYDAETGKLYDEKSQNQVDVQKSIEIGLVDPKISLIVDTATRNVLKLDCAIEDELVLPETGQIKDSYNMQLVPFDEGVEKQLVKTDHVKWSLTEILHREYYIAQSGRVLNPTTGEEILLMQAIDTGLVELDTSLVRDDYNQALVPAKAAIEQGLLDPIRGILTQPALKLDEAFVKGYFVSTKKPLSLVECIHRGLYDAENSQFSIDDIKLDLKSAIALKVINDEELVIRDPKTDSIITVREAISKGYLDPLKGHVINPVTNVKLTLEEALDKIILIPPKRKRSLPDAVFRGLYDPKTGLFSNTVTKEKLSTERAIRRGILDTDSTLVNVSNQLMPFEIAAETGVVDCLKGLVKDDNAKSINYAEAFERGILLEAKKPLRLMETIVKNIFDETDGTFMEPKTGHKLSFGEALDSNLLDEHSVQMRDNKTGLYKNLNLQHAREIGLIDPKDTKLVYNEQKLSLRQAFEIGILQDLHAPISIQRALHQGLFDELSGKLVDTKTGRKITLLEAMRTYVINPQLPCYFDEQEERMLNLSETARAGIIDRRDGVFREPGSNVFISLNKAFETGLIVDIETAGFGLYELLAMGFYDRATRKIIHPVTGRKMNLNEACIEDIVSLSSSLIKDNESDKYIRLAKAVLLKIVDDTEGCYNLKNGEQLDLQEARRRGLIVSNRRLLSLELVLRMKLFQTETGKFIDPTNDSQVDLNEAISNGFIDANTTMYKNQLTGYEIPLNMAIENGQIIVLKGLVLDPQTKSTYPYDKAFDRGVLISVRPNYTTRANNIVKKQYNLVELPKDSPREMTLKEMIEYNIIDPSTALVQHDQAYALVPYESAKQDGILDLNKKAVVDPKSVFFNFESAFIIWTQKPISFDEAAENGTLNLETGMFTYSPVKQTENDATEKTNTYTLKDAATMGYINPESALVKDLAKGKLVRLPEAFRKGLIDANKANVLDTNTSKLHTLKEAYELGLLLTSKRSLDLIESIKLNLYNTASGQFADPFKILTAEKQQTITLNAAIARGLIDASTTMVRHSINGNIKPLAAAISDGIIDGNTGKYVLDKANAAYLDLGKAAEKGLLLPAEQWQAVIEKFNLCEENVSELLKWVSSIENKISAGGAPKEKVEELRSQINSLKQIKEEIESNQRPVAVCLEQIRQIVLTGSDVLSTPEVTTLENAGRELRSRVDRVNDRTVRLLRRLETGRDELIKLRQELENFSTWLQSARRELEDKERSLSDLTRASISHDSIRDFVSDVISHQADLRFITMSAQKFFDESKEYLSVLNDFRTSLPERLPHIVPLSSSESPVRQEVSLVSAHYKDLMHRVNALQDRLSGLGGRQREYQTALEKLTDWLNGIQPRVSHVLNDPIAGDAKTVQEQMNEAKSLQNEILSNGRLLDNAQQALDGLLRTLGGQLNPTDIQQLEMPVLKLRERYQKMLDALSDYCKDLDKTLVQSQGVQDALDNLMNWANQAEDKLKLQMRPASLIKERLQEQIRDLKSLANDIQSHQSSIDSIQSSAKHLMNTTSNLRIAKKVESNLAEASSKFEKLHEKVNKRREFFDEVYDRLCNYLDFIGSVEQEITQINRAVEEREVGGLLVEDLLRKKEILAPRFDSCIQEGKQLISMRDVTDTNTLRDRIKALESQWLNINSQLDEKSKLNKQKSEQKLIYEKLLDEVLSWLSNTESRVNNLSAVAIDLNVLRQQRDELKPILKDYRDFGSVIDKINDIGAQYDILVHPDSNARKHSIYSPIKRASPLRRISGDARSPSPTKGGIMSPLSTASSGFGSRRSSQDGFQLSEMTPVQQQLNEVNNRYGLIGVRLNDRQLEIDNLLDEVRKQFDSLKQLSQFLERIQRQIPKELGTNKENADRCVKQARQVLEEMYEKQSLLDTTKAQVKELLRRKADVPGADQLRIENDTIVEKWKTLSDICKSRIEFSEKLRDFLDAYNNLKGWLDSKERLFTVLGPISTDPRMVQSQVQQVQVLREEFRTQQPQLTHFQNVGQDLVQHMQEPTEKKPVELKLKEITSKWEELLSILDERANNLGGAVDSSKEFDAAVNRLRESLQQISDNLENLPIDGDQQDTLRKIENLERQLEGQRPLLADAEQSAAHLCNILGDPASRSDINSRVAALQKQYQALQKKLDNKKAETESALRDGRNFAENCSKISGWLNNELSNLTERLLVSAHKPTLQHQIDAHEPIYREVMAREHEIIMLINKGKDLSDRQYDRGAKRDLERIQQQWEKLRREAVDRHTKLQTCMEHCKKYSKAVESFLGWLRSAEDKFENLKPCVFSKSALEARLRELNNFRNELWKHTGEFESVMSSGESFLNSCDIDKEPVKSELQDIRQRWERLNNSLIEQTQELDKAARRLDGFNDELRNLVYAVGRCEDRLAAHDSLGGAAKDPKLLDRIKAIRDELTHLSRPLDSLKATAKDISKEANAAGGNADQLLDEVDGISDRINELQTRLSDRCGDLQSAANAVSEFNQKMKAVGMDLNELEQVVETLPAPAREIKIVQQQIVDVGKVQNKMDAANDRLQQVERAADNLADAGFLTDSAQTREQLTGLRKILGRLDTRVRDHEDGLQNALEDLQTFYNMHDRTHNDIRDASSDFRKMKPVASELEQIRRQQEEMREFRDKEAEPLAQNVDKVNVAGRDLVRSAASGVSTATIERDLEKLNAQWNDLKERMNERDRRLDVALLQSGKFQEALAGLSKWLSDTEDMVANQKPPSSDYKVAKAQLQEQKFLKKMLLDRQNSMSSLSSLGKEVANHCDANDRNAIEKQLHDLLKRFDALTTGAEQREIDLEEAMKIAKHFHDAITPLELWLNNAERAVKAMELVPTDEEKIQQRIHEHDRLHDEILSKKDDFTEVADIAGQLMQLVSDEEAVKLGEKVRNITEAYTDLVDASEKVGELLGKSRNDLRHLVLTYQELIAWMEGMENDLKRFKTVPVYTEKLLEQMDILLELNENIANNAPSVEATVASGSELIKHISNDEAIQLKDKLDSLQRRYGDLANRGGDLLKSAQNALPMVQQFHEAHERLIGWLQKAEGALATSDPREADILQLETEIVEMRPVLDTVILIGPQLCQISPGEGASTIETIVTQDNRRFDAIVEQVQRKAERLHISNQRTKEVSNDIDELLEWFRDMYATLREADLPALEPKIVRGQLQEHRSLNDDIASQKGRVRDITAATKKVLRESPHSEHISTLREKLEDLKDVVDSVVQQSSERLNMLEQALQLAEHFTDSHSDLNIWLTDMEDQISRLSMPVLRPDLIISQQDKNERLLQSIAEHKPLLDKLNKTGETLAGLVSEDDQAKIHDILDSDNSRYSALKIELRERQQALENALQESSQFSDKIDGMLRALAGTADQVNQLEPLSAMPVKIKEQIDDNAAIINDLDKRADAFSAVQRAANDVIAKANNKSDPAVRDIKQKLEKLNNLWNDVQKATKKRGSSLDDILNVADPFWRQLNNVMATLKDLEEALSSQEPPAAQPQEIQKQQVALQEIRHEIDQTKPEVDNVRRHGNKLINMCGEPDKPEVKKHIEDLDNAWDNITALYAKREENLIDAMEQAMEFHETLQNLQKFLNKAEQDFARLGPVGSDIDAVKRQIEQLRAFKDTVDPHMVEIETLNRHAFQLTDRTSSEQADFIRKPLAEVNRKWDNLLQGMVERQKQLEHALLHLGQFQHALNELLVWISKSNNTLSQLKTIPGDPQLLEVEIAKLKVLVNDIQAHQNSVDTLNNAGRQLIESEKGSVEASATQDKLRKLNEEWKSLLQKAADKQHELEQALREAGQFIAEVQDILGWLGDVDAAIGASKPVGGLPETATEQLERFMEVYNELDENRPKVETIQAQGQEYIKRQTQIKVPSSNLTHTLRTLKQRWDAVVSRASDKKIKLEIALKEATEFHDTLQAFVEWLTQAEKQLANAPPVSRVLETIQQQIEDHKILQKDVSTHRESMLLLDKKGTHLKYFSQKQDVILIKNLLVSVQHRWERVVSKAAERTRALDHGYKETREFNDAWNSMMQYLQENEGVLDQIIQEASASKEPQKIKKCISKLKESHRQLASKQSVYEQTMRTGKSLIERAPKADEPVIRKMLNELKEQWSRVWSKSIERQRKLEEALLLSGQFSDALGELLDWLKKAKARASDKDNVHGDLETVQALIEYHKHFEQDLQKRSNQMQGVLKTGRELERAGNNPEVGRQLNELQTMWDDVKRATATRGERLQDALKDAEKLNGSIQSLFDWLDHAEHKLRYAKNAPDDEKASREMMEAHIDFLKDLRQRERQKHESFEFAELIITKAYQDAIPIIRNWLTIIQQRWDEISQWALDRQSKLEQHLQSLKHLDDAIEELLLWLNGLEATLLNLERESLPDEIPRIEKLIEDHKEFMENTARRQNEVDRACKPKQLPAGVRKMTRNTKTPLRGSSHDVREQSPDSSLRRQSFKGSREQGLNIRKPSRATPNRDTPDRDRLPHYGPRFSPSTAAPELEFRSSRAKLLWDKWRHVWMLSWERQRRLHDHLMYLKDVERVRNFSWEDWRKRFLKYMNHKKSRLTDLFRKMDKDNNGLIPRAEFIDGILNTKFDTSRMEMGAVADLFDRNGEGLIDWQEFIAALRPDWQERKPPNDSDKIHDEVRRLVMLCTCRQKFRVFQVGEGKYRFGDSQKLRLVRILRSTVMVRVGGGWVALDEFLLKNDPCRAKGRTNIELREHFILADGVTQSMAAFTPRRSTPNAAQNGTDRMSPYMTTGQGPIIKVRERSARSIPMSRNSRSVSASTPDSLSDNEGSHGASLSGRYTPRKVGTTLSSNRTGFTPSGSRAGSKPNSRPLSRQGSKPPSRHGSNLSLDSTDDTHTPSRIPQRKASNVSAGSTAGTPKTARFTLTSALATNGAKPRKTTSGSASPAPTSYGGMSRSSSIPTLTGFGFKPRRNIGGGITSTTPDSTHRVSDATISSTLRSRASRGTTPVGKREPFRL